MKKKVALLLVVCLLLTSVVSLAGCSNGGQQDAEGPEEGEQVEKKDFTIGILPFQTGCLWFDPFTAGGKWFLEDKGVKVLVQNPQWDTKKANTILQAWATDPDIDGVIAAPLGGEEILPGLRALKKAGKAVVISNNEAGMAPEALFCIRYNGVEACAGLAKKDLYLKNLLNSRCINRQVLLPTEQLLIELSKKHPVPRIHTLQLQLWLKNLLLPLLTYQNSRLSTLLPEHISENRALTLHI
jgi:hypothetical protein